MSLIQVSSREAAERLAPLGQFLFGAGIVLVLLRAIDFFTRMPGLPAFWYANQPMWIIIGCGLIYLGWKIQWGLAVDARNSWRPSVPGRRFKTVTLYSSEGCHLCEDATNLLNRYRQWLPIAEQIDIHSDPRLVEQFGTCVPVVAIDGKVRFRGRVNELLLQRLIEGSSPSGR